MSIVDQKSIAEYLDRFRKTYLNLANEYIPDEYRRSLARIHYFERGYMCHISTEASVAIEYGDMFPRRGRSRIGNFRAEYMLFQAGADVRQVNKAFFIFRGSNCLLDGATYKGEWIPAFVESPNAHVTLHNVLWEGPKCRKFVELADVFFDNSQKYWSAHDGLPLASKEIMAAMTDVIQSQRAAASLPNYLINSRSKTVLVLGDFSPSGRERLERICRVLMRPEYQPILLDSIPDLPTCTLLMKARIVAGLSRFVVFDDSSKSGHLAELGNMIGDNWITIVLRRAGSDVSSVFRGVSAHSKVIMELEYDDDSIAQVIENAISWAEDAYKKVSRQLNYSQDTVEPRLFFPWHTPHQSQ